MPRTIHITPNDQHNIDLVQNVHPSDWINPEPAPLYNLVVIGAGPAGLIAAAGAAGLGAKVALIERHLMGGDCLNVGCVPSKALIKSSRIAHEIKMANEFGLDASVSDTNFGAVMERLRKIRAGIAHHDSAQRFSEMGIDVFLGNGSFITTDTIEVDGKHLRFKKAVIATGAKATVPQIDGIDEADYLTNESVFDLTERPSRIAVYGGGPIGCELAQAFRRLGSKVTMIVRSRLSSKDEPEASQVLAETFTSEGIDIKFGAKLKKVSSSGKVKTMTIKQSDSESLIECDQILIALGRTPNVTGMGLESAGIEFDDQQGVHVNDRLQTSNPAVFAAGDICMKHKFTHSADAAARIVIQNALFMGRKKLSSLLIPRCTYTDPEIACVGITEKVANESNLPIDIYGVNVDDLDRAHTDSETTGFIKVITKKNSDRILGATIVSSHAGEMISEITTAMMSKMGLGSLANVIHPYPTQAEVIKRAADAYNRTRLSPTVASLFKKWFKWNLR